MRLLTTALLSLALSLPVQAAPKVTTVDLLATTKLSVNAAGPVLVKVDAPRNRVVTANTLTSTLTFIDGNTEQVTNVPIGKRAHQHLKSEAMAIRAANGSVYLIVTKGLVVVDRTGKQVQTATTDVQYEAVAVDEATGNAFLVGRETGKIGFWNNLEGRLQTLPWLTKTGKLVNENQTPPPPLRKVVALPGEKEGKPGTFAAVDGESATFALFDAASGRKRSGRAVALTPGGRWHLAGVNPTTRQVYLVTETPDRKVLQAARIDTVGTNDLVVPLPGFSEGVSMVYDPKRDRVYIPYDNHASLHVVDFAGTGTLTEVPLPAYGNDASALDVEKGRLYLGSWAHGEVEVVDVEKLAFAGQFRDLGILPHMHAMAFSPNTGRLYFPLGATAVNGSFGASLTVLEPANGRHHDIRLGWSPIDLVEVPSRGSFLVFSNEDRMAEVKPDGTFFQTDLPARWPTRALAGPQGQISLAYGPHQSYWPVVYIWGAKNGLLNIDPATLALYDRRLPRQPLGMVFSDAGELWLAQNNWGKEKAFLSYVQDTVRYPDINQRIELPDEVVRETTQRLLAWDKTFKKLVLVRVGEDDEQPGVLQVIDPVTKAATLRVETGRCPADLLVDDLTLYVANFQADTVTVVNKTDGKTETKRVDDEPLRLVEVGDQVWVLHHRAGKVRNLATGKYHVVDLPGPAEGMWLWRDRLVVASHGPQAFRVVALDPATGKSETLLSVDGIAYGDTSFDTGNASFYLCGQYGDALPSPTVAKVDSAGRLWISDFLSGKVYILE